MEATDASLTNANEVDALKHQLNDILTKLDQLEHRIDDVELFYVILNKKQTNNSKGSSVAKDKERDRAITSVKKHQQDALHREAAASKRMQELIRQFGTLFRQITQHKRAWPFQEPVDAEKLGLDDYYQSESTLWRLKFFVKDALEVQGKANSAGTAGTLNINNNASNLNNKRKRFVLPMPREGTKRLTQPHDSW